MREFDFYQHSFTIKNFLKRFPQLLLVFCKKFLIHAWVLKDFRWILIINEKRSWTFKFKPSKRATIYSVALAFHFFQLHVPVQLPCYDFIQIANFSMGLTKLNLQAKLTFCMWRAVCTRLIDIFTATCWFAITSDSNFM